LLACLCVSACVPEVRSCVVRASVRALCVCACVRVSWIGEGADARIMRGKEAKRGKEKRDGKREIKRRMMKRWGIPID